ncbi:energy-coupled thiamine transporter ThiT [Clostridium taeniosporum]|uniref:Energy-coupled thiamine transporter ThiT n=1 Tax=Clostridium taeniosporum TaxID=394958 RepID=A0A1D7XG27_9CLOT|nr:energy-coupled thiamine transporter ThiT [Clostridium taeniosporum]AOR22306.1 energy-coupled thiamine transporter ThiT [Clostridium taeniosporum]
MSIFNDWAEQISNLYNHLPQNVQTVISDPLSIITLLGCIVILVVLVKAKKIKFTPQLIARIGIALALATILKIFRIYHFPQGGSITFGSMVPILLIAFMYGPQVGFLTGFLYGMITLFMDPYILHPIQVLFDYPLPFLCLGIAGFLPNKKYLGVILAVLGRFICHFISGVAFFGSFAPEGMSPALYSLSVNGPIIGIEGIICLVIIAALPIARIISVVSNRKVTT